MTYQELLNELAATYEEWKQITSHEDLFLVVDEPDRYETLVRDLELVELADQMEGSPQ
jgi:hypothetical protein